MAKNNHIIRDITIMGILTTILFIQEQILTFLPNVQLTILLIVLYSKCLGFKKTSIIVLIHVLLDSIVMGTINFIFFPFIYLGYILIPLLLCTVFRKVNEPIYLAFLGILFAFIYSWCYIIPSIIVSQIDIVTYLLADIPFEILLAGSSFISILWLYKPLKKIILKYYHNQNSFTMLQNTVNCENNDSINKSEEEK